MIRPTHITEEFWHELTSQSAIKPELAALNARFIQGDEVYASLLYALPQSARRNDGRLRDGYLRRYEKVADNGGLQFSGLDPVHSWEQPMEWNRIKPVTPRGSYQDNELQKYESPAKTPNRVSYFRVDKETWELVAKRYSVPMPEKVVVTEDGHALGFWAWVQTHPKITPILVEGEKKALCMLSLGFAAISLPGCWGGRVGEKESEQIHPDLVPVAQVGRKFIILFDYETKPHVKRQIYQASCRTGWAISRQDCYCEVALLPGSEKGIDDWVVALGKKAGTAVTAMIADARTISEYQREIYLNRVRGLHKYKPNVKVNTRFLSDAIPKLPDAGLVCLLSDMGTGKTELLAQWRQEHPLEVFLNNGHRVNLLKNLASRLKTCMYSAVNAGDLAKASALSITVDSLYKLASGLQDYGCVFIDEACQYLAHLLKSKTCREHRASILEVLECVVYRAKLVVLADAHLDDLTIDFFRNMRPPGEEPFIIQNSWKVGGRDTYWYEGGNSSALVAKIHAEVMTGKKAIVVSDSKRFIKKLERSLLMLESAVEEDATPEPEVDRKLRVWAIHSENSGSEENVTFIEEINTAVKSIDVLLTSPSLGTGVDISDYHFDIIFGAFHSVSQSATECAQQLWRYRPNVPMHVWVAERPPFGYAETNPRRIKQRYLQKNEMTAFLIRIDRETGKRGVEKDWALDTSCLIEAQRNWSINNLRSDLRSLLESMGNTLIPMGDKLSESAKNLMKAAGQVLDLEYYKAVANAADIDSRTYKARLQQDYLKPEEAFECEKFRIQDAYGMEVTPELVEKDDGGRLISKLVALEAILSEPGEIITDEHGKEFITPPQLVVERDKSERDRLSICTDWANYSTTWLMRHQLGMKEILKAMMAGEWITATNEMLQSMAERAHKFAPHIKQILGLTIPGDSKPMWILGKFLEQLALFTTAQRVGSRGARVRQYTLSTDEVEFAQQVLNYRQQRREEKERKHHQDREIAERRTAAIATQYGIPPHSPPVSTSPQKCSPAINGGDVDTKLEQEEILTAQWWSQVKNYTQLVVERLVSGVQVIKEVLICLSSEEKWGVVTQLEDDSPENFERFALLMPDWIEFCNA